MYLPIHLHSLRRGFALIIVGMTVPGLPAVHGDVVTYSSIAGDNVTFSDICETSTGTGPYYGQPFSLNDTSISAGVGFLSQSVNSQIGMVDGRLQMTISANPGFEFNSISVRELGSFLGFGSVAAVVAAANASVVTDQGTYSGNFFFGNFGNGSGGWDESFTINFPSTTSVAFTLDHQLLSAAGPESGAFIDTSSIQISVGARAISVPEPSLPAFMAMMALTLVPKRWRR
jgi:hypothetical protein